MFHFLLAWEPEFEEKSIEQHQCIIEGRGAYERISQKYVWWGKFAKPLDKDGQVAGPCMDEENLAGNAAEKVVAEANRRIQEGSSVYLFIVNPNKGPESLYVARIRRAVFTPDQPVPPDDDLNPREKRPQCAYMCDYYFFKSKDLNKCVVCTRRDDNCRTRRLCNFFFKIDKLEHRPSEWDNLELAPNNPRYPPRPDNRIRLSVQNYYPALVRMKRHREYWQTTKPLPGPPDLAGMCGPENQLQWETMRKELGLGSEKLPLPFELRFTPFASRMFEALSSEAQKRVTEALDNFEVRAMKAEALRGNLIGFSRLHEGRYRIVFKRMGKSPSAFLIVGVGHRKEVYDSTFQGLA